MIGEADHKEVCLGHLQLFVACTGKVSPSRIICVGLLEEGRVSVAGPNGE